MNTLKIADENYVIPCKSAGTRRDNGQCLSKDSCILFSIWVDYNGVLDAYLHIFDNLEVPADGAVPDFPPVPLQAGANGTFMILDMRPGVPMKKGVSVAISSSRDTLAKPLTNDGKFFAIYLPASV